MKHTIRRTAHTRAGHRLPADRSAKKPGPSANSVGDHGWEQLFASKTLVALLKLFLLNPEAAFYQRELADAAGTRLYAVQRELARLERIGLVVKTPRGNRAYYRTDRHHPAFEDLKRIVMKTVGLGDALRASLAPLRDRVRVAFVYGSYAAGKETVRSDIDLFVIGSLTVREAASVLGPVGTELGREFNTVVYSPEEFTAKFREGHHFVRAIMKGPKVFLVGNQRELARLAE